ncbi:MAG: hypothetical protein O3A51_10350, partial [Verrucomicrobia bacterium]|nr:hypothetical protein [Verrucomicrobiota bacterium]
MTLTLIPQPKKLRARKGRCLLPNTGTIGISHPQFADVARAAKALWPKLTLSAAVEGLPNALVITTGTSLQPQGYRLRLHTKGVQLEAATPAAACHGLQTLQQIVRQAPSGTVPCCTIDDWPDFENRGVYYDVTRGRVPTREQLINLATRLADYKINELQLYIEHTFLFRGHPLIGRGASPLTAEDILALDRHCQQLGIELVPSL